MQKLIRIWRHLCSTRSAARRAFPATTLQAIQATIGRGEAVHRAEVRVVVEAALPLAALWQGESARARAHELFSHYRIWDTEENCGILLYINLADHKVELLPDRGVAHAVKRADWQLVCATITDGFAQELYHDSVLAALTQLNALLAQHFPCNGSHQNQLSDRPLLL